MGNYAVYFTVENKLDVDLRLVNIRFNHGEVEENPNNGFIPAKTESGTFRFGGVGTWGADANFDLVGAENHKAITIGAHVACLVTSKNEVSMWSDDRKDLNFYFKGDGTSGEPLEVKFTITY